MGTKNLFENGPNPFFLFGNRNMVRPTLMGTKNLYETGPNPFKVDSYGNEKIIRKWTKSVFFIRDQKFGQADSYGNEKLIRNWTKSDFFIRSSSVVVLLHQ